jgi:hypothetical protein
VYPTLVTIAAVQQIADDGTRQGLDNVAMIKGKVRQALAQKRVNCQGIVKLLMDCSSIRKEDAMEDRDTGSLVDEFSGYTKHVKTLRRVLEQYADCTCTKQELTDRHVARIRLKPVNDPSNTGLVRFEMLFSASPNPSRTSKYEWQDVEISVPV